MTFMWWRLIAGHDRPGGGDAEAARAHPQHSRSAAGELIVKWQSELPGETQLSAVSGGIPQRAAAALGRAALDQSCTFAKPPGTGKCH
jgi:hypothetical protein